MLERERAYRVYVIRLKRSVWTMSRKFREANPQYVEGRPLVYVGSTGKTPEQRFETHMKGGRGASRLVKRFGKRLFPYAYADLPGFSDRGEAERAEEQRAQELRARGWGVWCNARPLDENLGGAAQGEAHTALVEHD